MTSYSFITHSSSPASTRILPLLCQTPTLPPLKGPPPTFCPPGVIPCPSLTGWAAAHDLQQASIPHQRRVAFAMHARMHNHAVRRKGGRRKRTRRRHKKRASQRESRDMRMSETFAIFRFRVPHPSIHPAIHQHHIMSCNLPVSRGTCPPVFRPPD